MHKSAMSNAKRFFESYLEYIPNPKIIEIGSQDVNGSLRDVCPSHVEYIGVDFVEGKGVDVILTDPYHFPFENETADVVVSSSCLEHSEMFWLAYLEMLRIIKPHGLLYLNVPSNGGFFHRFPVDCWRFYPDSGTALVTWAKHNGLNPALLESYVSNKDADYWNDFVGVFVKEAQYAGNYPERILNRFQDFKNGQIQPNEFQNHQPASQDAMTIYLIHHWLNKPLSASEIPAGTTEANYRISQIQGILRQDKSIVF